MNIKKLKKNEAEEKCQHKNIIWMNSICMIAGYKKEGICSDCGANMLKDIEGRITESNGIH